MVVLVSMARRVGRERWLSRHGESRMTSRWSSGQGKGGSGRACFFFQAEDGIRDGRVTGVQTCALPIFARLRLARDRSERVLVFGDFDADGLTGLAILTIALRRFGVAVEPYVPSRLDEEIGRASCREREERAGVAVAGEERVGGVAQGEA